jgi:hypothetical protein
VFKPPPPEAARCATCGKERGDARHSAGSYDADHAFAPPPAGGEGQVSDEEFERLVTNEPNIFGHDEVSIGRLVAEARRARASEAALAEAIGVVLNEKYLVGKGEWVAVSRPAFDGLKAALGAKEAGK